MRVARWLALSALLLSGSAGWAQRGYVGFDKDGYPGDDRLPALHKTFAFTGHWLSGAWAVGGGRRDAAGAANG